MLGARGAGWLARIAAPALVGLAPGGALARDNFLVVVADDVGVDKVNVYSRDDLYGHPGEGASPGPTPTIDALATDGVLFRNAYGYPTCSPTRAAALTGRYGFRTGIGNPSGGPLLDIDETLLPELLAGTHSNAAFGKWHLGGNDPDHPNDSGFAHFAGALAGQIPSYFLWPKLTDGVVEPGYAVYATTDNADEAIASIAGFGANPWFVWLAFNAGHTPFHAPPAGLHTQVLAGVPALTPVPHYEAAVEAMDTELARVLASIPADVLADTTIVFMGDNGTTSEVVEPPFIATKAKSTTFEGGINVPFIVKSPRVPLAERGSESLALVHVVDLFASVAEIAGVASAAEDSHSLLPYLEDPSLGTLAARPYAYSEKFSPNGLGPYDDEERAIRGERYKLIWRNGSYEDLYDLELDPFEETNLLLGALSPEQQAAYDALVAAIEALHGAGAEVPALSHWGALLAAVLVALSASASLRRARPVF